MAQATAQSLITRIRRLALILVAAALCASPPPSESASVEAAQKAAESRLVLHDAGDYAKSYEQAANYVKNVLSPEEWEKTMRTHRAPLGSVKTRKLTSATYTAELPGVPDGKYVVLLYETSFENKKSAVETVIPLQEADGQWKVFTYRIR